MNLAWRDSRSSEIQLPKDLDRASAIAVVTRLSLSLSLSRRAGTSWTTDPTGLIDVPLPGSVRLNGYQSVTLGRSIAP